MDRKKILEKMRKHHVDSIQAMLDKLVDSDDHSINTDVVKGVNNRHTFITMIDVALSYADSSASSSPKPAPKGTSPKKS